MYAFPWPEVQPCTEIPAGSGPREQKGKEKNAHCTDDLDYPHRSVSELGIGISISDTVLAPCSPVRETIPDG